MPLTNIATPRTFMGLPTTGAMGAEPALTVAGVMGAVALIFGIIVQMTGFQLPLDIQIFLNEYGTMLTSVAIGVYTLIAGAIVRNKVVAPATAADAVVAARVAGANVGSSGA